MTAMRRLVRPEPNVDDAQRIFPSLDNYSSSYWLLFLLTPSLMNLSTCSVIPMTTEGQSAPQSASIQSQEHIQMGRWTRDKPSVSLYFLNIKYRFVLRCWEKEGTVHRLGSRMNQMGGFLIETYR